MKVRRPRYTVAALAVAASLGLHVAVLSLALRKIGPPVEAPRAPMILSLAGASLAHLSEAEPPSEAIAGAGEVATAPLAPESPPASAVDPAGDPSASPVPEPPPAAAEPRPVPSSEPVPPVAAIEPVPMPPSSPPAESREMPATAEPALPPRLAAATPPASPEPLPNPAPPDVLPEAGPPGLPPAASVPPPMRLTEAAPGEIGPVRDITPAPAPPAGALPEAMGQTLEAVPMQGGEVSPPAMPATADELPAAGASVAVPAGIAPPPARAAEVASAEVGPAREAPAVAVPATIVPPEVPPWPVGAVGVAATGVASLEAPAVSAERVHGFVDRYDGGPCFFASVTRTTPTSADVETFSATVDQVIAFHAAFTGQIGVEPDVVGQKVWSAQCPAVEFLRRTRSSSSLTLELDRRNLRSGEPLSGTITGITARHVGLYLVSEDGVVTDLTENLRIGEDQAKFRISTSRQVFGGPFPQLLVAIVGAFSRLERGTSGKIDFSDNSSDPIARTGKPKLGLLTSGIVFFYSQ